ncbi:hypothetical protein GCM10009564_04990 [Streptomyces thermogriseus]|uniref:Uncharacterized protein n=1 Tax=Streptomyces thermogriseus TaxID=75292 RepID=A0ABP4DBI0_9ACTN
MTAVPSDSVREWGSNMTINIRPAGPVPRTAAPTGPGRKGGRERWARTVSGRVWRGGAT